MSPCIGEVLPSVLDWGADGFIRKPPFGNSDVTKHMPVFDWMLIPLSKDIAVTFSQVTAIHLDVKLKHS